MIAALSIAMLCLVHVRGESTTELSDEEVDLLDVKYGPTIYAVLMYNHGHRTPSSTIPGDIYADPKYWPEGLFHLTKKGILQHYSLGKWIGKKYKHLIPEWRRLIQGIQVFSTTTDRTLMSADANVAGMLPIDVTQEWDGMTSYILPIYAIQSQDDNLLELTKDCYRFGILWNASIYSEENHKLLAGKYKRTVDLVESNWDFKVQNIRDLSLIYMNLLIEDEMGRKLSPWTEEIYPSILSEAMPVALGTATASLALKRLKGGNFVKVLIGNFTNKINGDSANLTIFSSHDTAMFSIMDTMGISNQLPVPFASLVAWELRMPPDSDEPAVTITYRNSTEQPPYVLRIPGCAEACPLSEMKKLMEPVMADDWEAECREDPLEEI